MAKNEKVVTIDFFPGSAFRYLDYDAVVCLDIIRATTTLVTAVASGRRAYAARDFEEARILARGLDNPLLAGERERNPDGHYEIANSPAALAARTDLDRPLVLVSTYGTRLLANARGSNALFIASLQNLNATADMLVSRYSRVALLGACSDGELRCEDQLAAARLGLLLRERGYAPGSRSTVVAIERWGHADTGLIRLGRSAERLLRTGHGADLEFVLAHLDDLNFACSVSGCEIARLCEEVEEEEAASPVSAAGGARASRYQEQGEKLARGASDWRMTG